MVAGINYMSVDPDMVHAYIDPVIRIDTQKIAGLRISNFDQKNDKVQYELLWSPEFDPESKLFNVERVKFYNRALPLFKKAKQNYGEIKCLNDANNYFNGLSFPITNFVGAMANWLIVGQALLALIDIIDDKWGYRKLATGLSYIIAIPSFVLVTNTVIEFYELFTIESITDAMKTFFSTDNALYQAFLIDFFCGLESTMQWFTNGIARGFTFGLGFGVLLDTIFKFVQPFSDVSISTTAKIFAMVIIGILCIHNTLGSRMKGAKKYLAPFTIEGPLGLLKLVVPDPKLLAAEIKQATLTNDEQASIWRWAFGHGLTWGVPISTLMILLGGQSIPFSIGMGFTAFLLKFVINSQAEKPFKIFTKARKKVNDKIEACQKKIEITLQQSTGNIFSDAKTAVKKELDKNGNEKLTNADINRLNVFCNFLDQMQRDQGRGGTVGELFTTEHTLKDVLLLGSMFGIAFITPQVCEFETYKQSTAPVLLNALQGFREYAGADVDDLKAKGCCERTGHFFARQLACFMPCLASPNGKPLAGFTGVWLSWFCGRWSYRKPTAETKAEMTSTSINSTNGSTTRPKSEPTGWSRIWCCKSQRPSTTRTNVIHVTASM